MFKYQWEATAYEPETRTWRSMHGEFTADVEAENVEKVALRVAQGYAEAIGCDADSIDGLHYDMTDCEHKSYHWDFMGPAICNDCGQAFQRS